MAAEDAKKVRIFVVGDTGVGKSSLVHLICYNNVLSNPSTTIGCSVEVKLHDHHKDSSPQTHFIEFWDVGGSPAYSNGRTVFYNQIHGIILVHDLTNKKSYANLRKVWLPEVLAQGRKNAGSSRIGTEYDPEQFAGDDIPVLVVGTKQDLINMMSGKSPSGGSIAVDTGSDSINVDCTSAVQFTVGTPNMIKLNHFFDKVIEWKYSPKQYQQAHYQTTPSEMRRPRRTSKIQ